MLPLRIFASLQVDNRNFLLPVDGQMFVFGNLHHLLGWFRNSSEIKLIKKKTNPNHCFLSSCDGSFSKQTWKKKKHVSELLAFNSYDSVSGTYSQRLYSSVLFLRALLLTWCFWLGKMDSIVLEAAMSRDLHLKLGWHQASPYSQVFERGSFDLFFCYFSF